MDRLAALPSIGWTSRCARMRIARVISPSFSAGRRRSLPSRTSPSCRPNAGVAINPWQPHSFQPCSGDQPSVFLVAYICQSWLDRDQEGRGSLRFGGNLLRVGTTIRSICASLAHTLVTNASYRIVNRYLNQLFDASFDESWRAGSRLNLPARTPQPIDFRVRKSLRFSMTASPKASNSTMSRAMPAYRVRISSSFSARIPA